ncbi:HD domain-containing phosphohydrolase [Thauera sp.]|jgi:putative two-component system response regulator|uniref:HD domain-containing phosphohydrolase n=1 Tax=Thauera sp. TaxID=1905334 RepID=UPI002609B4DB|nr:HD domain-containing phosphohydrolase [Thauera sp.]MCK6408427.1 response regulator [Thauera sp.]
MNPSPDHRMQVAVVDDTPLNLSVIGKLVDRMPNACAHTFERPTAALEWCLANEPDLIIVDYMMPDMDGLEFVRRMRAYRHQDDLPILMVTASHERHIRYGALDCGASDFLTKPIDGREFEARVRNMLKLREAFLASSQRTETLAAEVRKATADILDRERETITRLSRAAEFRDPETGAHIQRMSHYSALIARQLGLGEELAEALLMAAPMHDVGKLGIPDTILLKPGRLTPEEFAVMKRHPQIGHDILKGSSSSILRLGATIALTHHERFDGSGYPRGLAGAAIPIEGRIVSVADVFDALTSSRPYKPAWPMSRAIALLREGRGSHFDPHCVDALLHAWDGVLAVQARYQDEDAPSAPAVPA